MRPHPKRARVNPNAPSAWGTCDRCGMITNLRDMDWHREWAGSKIINLGYLNCPRCQTIPNETLRTIVLPPDPDPVLNARPENYALDESPGLIVLADRHALEVVIVSPGIKRPLLSVGVPPLLTSP